MAERTYYQQHPMGPRYTQPPTFTVGELIEKLQGLDPSLPVITRSPRYGCFGSGTTYALGEISRETLAEQEIVEPARTIFDEEEGREHTIDEDRYTLVAWDGVVLS